MITSTGLLKFGNHHLVERQFFAGPELIGTVRDPEIGCVDDKEKKDQRSEQCHASAIPCAVFGWVLYLVTDFAASSPVLKLP